MGNLPPGWYADERGVERWWDGADWTDLERATPVVSVDAAAVVDHAAAAIGPPVDIVPGWYAVPGTDEVRWWDGMHWTASVIDDGEPHAQHLNTTARSALRLAVLPGVLTLVFAGIAVFLPSTRWTALAFFVPLAVMTGYMVFAALAAVRRVRRPNPVGDPVYPETARPVLGEVEANHAGWYPAPTADHLRWWTGTRWAQYVWDGVAPRPSFGDERGYRALLWVAGALFAVFLGSIVWGAVVPHADLSSVVTAAGFSGAAAALLGTVSLVVRPRVLIAKLRAPAMPDQADSVAA